MRVLLAISNTYLRNTVKEILKQHDIQISGEVTKVGEIIRKARTLQTDAVIIDTALEGTGIRQVAMVLEEDGVAPVIMIATQGDPETREFAYVLKPVNSGSLIPAVNSAVIAYRKMRLLAREIQHLREQLATRKVVEIAKGLIMKEKGLSEEEAHRMLQKLSMDKGIPLKAVAEAIITLKEII